jgi:hypothetical protein
MREHVFNRQQRYPYNEWASTGAGLFCTDALMAKGDRVIVTESYVVRSVKHSHGYEWIYEVDPCQLWLPGVP